VLATIHELGRDDIELNLVDLFQGEHKSPEFLKLNPNGKVPVLEDGDYSLLAGEQGTLRHYSMADLGSSPLGSSDRQNRIRAVGQEGHRRW
jgi:glutathione S-transferase